MCLNNLKIYNSIKEASIELNIFSQNICGVLKGKHKSTKGYEFIFY